MDHSLHLRIVYRSASLSLYHHRYPRLVYRLKSSNCHSPDPCRIKSVNEKGFHSFLKQFNNKFKDIYVLYCFNIT